MNGVLVDLCNISRSRSTSIVEKNINAAKTFSRKLDCLCNVVFPHDISGNELARISQSFRYGNPLALRASTNHNPGAFRDK